MGNQQRRKVVNMEQWKSITTHPNYEVSNFGRVRNITTGEFKKPSINKEGYVRVSLHDKENVISIAVHRLVAIYFIPNPENNPLVNHIDSIRHNNMVFNLEWVTHSENSKHMVSVGNNSNFEGTNNPRAKFTEAQILDIRHDLRVDEVIAKDYNVAPSTITNIKNGTRYTSIGGPIRTKGARTNQVRGENQGTAAITNEIARQIKYELFPSGMTQAAIAKKFNITKNVVYRVVHNMSYSHV